MHVHGEMGTRNNKITNPAELVGSEVVGWLVDLRQYLCKVNKLQFNAKKLLYEVRVLVRRDIRAYTADEV
jgi:hypothetical protein